MASYGHGARTVPLDRTDYGPLTESMTAKIYVRDLAKLLLNVDPITFGLLKCEGVIELLGEMTKDNSSSFWKYPKAYRHREHYGASWRKPLNVLSTIVFN